MAACVESPLFYAIETTANMVGAVSLQVILIIASVAFSFPATICRAQL